MVDAERVGAKHIVTGFHVRTDQSPRLPLHDSWKSSPCDAVMRIREALDAICLILTVSANRRLTLAETEELEELCFIIDHGLPARPISSRAVRDFAENIRKSGLINHGHAAEVENLLKDAESLRLLVG